MQDQEVARVNIEIAADGKTECMFAEPVGAVADDGSGYYRLLNTAFFAPFVLHDIVEVEKRDGELRVVGLDEMSECTAYDVRFAAHVTVAQMQEVTQRWLDADAYVARCEDEVYVVTVLPDSKGPAVHELDALEDEGFIKYDAVRDGSEDLSVWPPL
jgi:hypothetical protein